MEVNEPVDPGLDEFPEWNWLELDCSRKHSKRSSANWLLIREWYFHSILSAFMNRTTRMAIHEVFS